MTAESAENMGLEEIDELLKPVTEINLDRLHPVVLDHLEEELKLLTYLVQLRTNRQQV